MKRTNCRGHLFNTFHMEKSSTLVESYDRKMPLAHRPVTRFQASDVLFPEMRHGNHRVRLIYSIPKHAVRALGLDNRAFTAAFGAAYASVLNGYLAANPVSSFSEPGYYYVNRDFSSNHPVIASVLYADKDLAGMVCAALDYIIANNSIALHGRFTTGAMLVDSLTGTLCVMSGISSFMGPVEYDLASTLQNTVERITQGRRQSTPVSDLALFFHTLIDKVESRHSVSRGRLYHLLVYMYLGHINFYLSLQEKTGGSIFTATDVRATTRKYAMTARALLRKEPLP